MLEFEARERFAGYLRESMSQSMLADLKDVVSSAKKVLSLKFRNASSDHKNLVFQQKQILLVAEQYLEEKPCVTYFAALKHIVFLKSRGIDAATFDDFKDKEYVLEVERYAEKLATSAEAKISAEVQNNLHELIVLQQVEPLIPQCVYALGTIIDAPLAERERILFPPKKSFFATISRNPSKYDYLFKMNRVLISAAAERLKQKVETWICSPGETIQYLNELQKRRPLLEEKYLTV